MTDWHVGMRVVCWTTDRLPEHEPFPIGNSEPQLNRVFTIREVWTAPWCPRVGLRFYEIGDGIPGSYWDSYFYRPVRETKTDVSIFRKLIEPSELAKLKERIEA